MEVKMEFMLFEKKFPYYSAWRKIRLGDLESVEFLNVHFDKVNTEHHKIRKIRRCREKIGGNRKVHIY